VANREIVKHAVASNSLLERILQRIFRFPGLKPQILPKMRKNSRLLRERSRDSRESRANRLSTFGLRAVL
jgi:hypothetical protein